MSGVHVGYVLKRFPRASETFIAREILELESLGIEVSVLALRPCDTELRHDWLRRIRARVHCFPEHSFSGTWKQLRREARRHPERRPRVHRALLDAFDHPTRSGRRYLSEAVWAADLTRRLGLDHLHAHFANHPTFVAMLVHHLTGRPFSFTAHAKDIYADGPTGDLWRRQVGHAAFAVTVSEFNRDHLASILGPRLAGRVRRLYNGVDLTVAGLETRSPALSGEAPEILFVSRLIEKKGADVLLRAGAILRDRGVAHRLTLVGDGSHAGSLRRQAAALELGDSVRFTGPLPQEEVMRSMRRAALLALPCRVAADGDRDALPTVLLEAMSVGLPCVSTPVNGVPEIVDHPRTGLLVPENDPEALADGLAQLLADAEWRRRMGRAGRRRAARLFDARKNVAVLRDWFEESAAGNGRVAATLVAAQRGRR